MSNWNDYVSIRARPRGRAMPSLRVRLGFLGQVSIRARPRGRAMPVTVPAMRPRPEFQSAPGLEAGRCPDDPRVSATLFSFNPRPA